MRKTIYLHVGHYKTGSTALQVFLASNRQPLLRRGVDYASEMLNDAKHSQLAFSLYRAVGVETLMHGYQDPTPPARIWARLFDYVAASPAPNVLVSSEEFMRMGAHPKATALLREIVEPMRQRFDIRIIAYLRAPGPHLRSWYNQLVKMNTAPPDFNTAVSQVMEPVHYDYALALKPWIDIFGAEAVIIRPYMEEHRLDGGLFRDFLAQLKLDFDRSPRLGGWKMPERDVNPRLDDRLLELIRAMQQAGVPMNLRQWVERRAQNILPASAETAPAFTEVAARAKAGLDMLGALPNNAVDIAHFAANPPQAEPAWQAESSRILTLLLKEQNFLRERMYERNGELKTRLEAAEDRLDALERRLNGGK